MKEEWIKIVAVSIIIPMVGVWSATTVLNRSAISVLKERVKMSEQFALEMRGDVKTLLTQNAALIKAMETLESSAE